MSTWSEFLTPNNGAGNWLNKILKGHFIDLWKDEKLNEPWGHPVALNLFLLDWESIHCMS